MQQQNSDDVSLLHIIKKTCRTFLQPHAITVLTNATPPCHDLSKICLRITLDIIEDGPVIWVQKGGSNNNIQMMSVCYKNQEILQ